MQEERKDKVLMCKECSNRFVWSEEEQEIYKERGIDKPLYCPICRGKFEAEKKFKEKFKKEKKGEE